MPIDGFRYINRALGQKAQQELMRAIAEGLEAAPFFQPRMPKTGKEFSVRMSNFGRLGWVSDKEGGYRYQATHPDTGLPWPPIPDLLLRLWEELAACSRSPEACLVNFYRPGARMGSHRDVDEKEPRAPVLSVSLGCEAVFHVGGIRRSDAKERFVLKSGDVVVLGGPARFAYHGIDRVLPGTSDLVAGGGRINLTLRRVTPFAV